MSTAQSKNYTKNEKKVLKAYSGGKTEEEAKIALTRARNEDDRLEESQARKIRSRLEKQGSLIRSKGRPAKWYPKDELAIPLPDAYTEKNDKPEEIPSYASSLLAERTLELLEQTLDEIDRDPYAWRKPRKIRRICNNSIVPVVEPLAYLKKTLGYSVTLPWEYFKEERPPQWKTLLGWADLRGSIGIPTPGTTISIVDGNLVSSPPKEKSDWLEKGNWVPFIYPGLKEWKEYLIHVQIELECELRRITDLSDKSSLPNTPNHQRRSQI